MTEMCFVCYELTTECLPCKHAICSECVVLMNACPYCRHPYHNPCKPQPITMDSLLRQICFTIGVSLVLYGCSLCCFQEKQKYFKIILLWWYGGSMIITLWMARYFSFVRKHTYVIIGLVALSVLLLIVIHN